MLAKYPTPGEVKTRLAPMLGAEAACALYRAFVLDLAARLRRTAWPLWWAFAPPTAPFAQLVRSRRCFAQTGGDLGARLAHATGRLLRATAAPVIALGADVPHVPVRALREAARALAGDADVVLGPAADGGYYLIGLRRPTPALFRNVPWSTRHVLPVTRRRCRLLGLRLRELEPCFDVVDAAGLQALEFLLATRGARLPTTRRTLRRLRALGPMRRSGPLPPAASPSSDCAPR